MGRATLHSAFLGAAILVTFFSPRQASSAGKMETDRIDPGVRRVCDGFDEQWAECKGPPCNECSPKNCIFSAWQDWFDAGGCSQLAFRHRTVGQVNNECGGPCTGPKIESKRVVKPKCNFEAHDCVLKEWSDWTACGPGKELQSTRYRSYTPAINGGKECQLDDSDDIPTKETRACERNASKGCDLSAWHDWTSCSARCGVGQHTRMRRVEADADQGGKACYSHLQEVADCHAPACPFQDCQLSAWVQWSACLDKHSQSYRFRVIDTPALGDGGPCNGALQETRPCPKPPVTDCEISVWSEWTACPKTCGVGQIERSRQFLRMSENGGTCNHRVTLRMTMACNKGSCLEKQDCEFSTWSAWSDCKAECGVGPIYRERTIVQFAKDGGEGCAGYLNEIGKCTGTDCSTEDCTWGDWYDWSACTCTCGGGTKTRTRVVTNSPRLGGKLCSEKIKSEVVMCNTQTCLNNCVDATWEDWSAWGACSSTCSDGFQARNRRFGDAANACGKPLEGEREQYQTCSNNVECFPSQDCTLGEWGDWSSCSCTCFGNRERNRVITAFARGVGQACRTETLKEFEPCNPGLMENASIACGQHPPQDCVLSAWAVWGDCSATCGGGQRYKSRKIITYPAHRGSPCEGELTMVGECNTKSCTKVECIDCEWGEWAEWGDCSHCGGQRYRFRHIKRMANECGAPCELGSAKEVSNCTSPCGKLVSCAWSAWSSMSGCQVNSCGGSAMRTRNLALLSPRENQTDFLFKAGDTALCAGTQLDTETCDRSQCKPDCTPQDCTFGVWSEWTQQTCLGLCFRSRVITTPNNHCGAPCQGDLEETKRCKTSCNKPVDCKLSSWTEWNACTDPSGQSDRSRSIKLFPINGGAACAGTLAETRPCGGGIITHDCEFSIWTTWSACSVQCDFGYTLRSREIVKESSGGGSLCSGSLQDLKACRNKPCTLDQTDCTVSAWMPWGECQPNRQQRRERVITKLAHGGTACLSELKETRTCGVKKTDCQMSEWTKWDTCDRTCNGGQQQRHRQVHTFPTNGGKSCPTVLIMQRGCNTGPCGPVTDCALSSWGEWGQCEGKCGGGQTTRNRSYLTKSTNGGKGCEGMLSMTIPCSKKVSETLPPCGFTDCKWGEWSDWSACTCTCGGGQRNRNRHIEVMPSPGGKSCRNEDREMVVPCNTQSCTGEIPHDGEWGDWSVWSECSATCRTGVTFRIRKVSVMASRNGNPPYGKDRESIFCNANVSCSPDADCTFREWQEWSDCSESCSGVKRRSRGIAQYGKGNGGYCVGATKETYPCNSASLTEPAPPGCGISPPVDCEMGDWSAWSSCSATCGAGQQDRSRIIVTMPQFGGLSCSKGAEPASLREVKQCYPLECPGEAVDCKLGDWDDWNACGKCGGQRKRFRRIIQFAKHGGSSCDAFDGEELGSCPFLCEDHGHCVWGDWGAYGPCSAACGTGKQMRTRKLVFSATKDPLRTPQEQHVLMKEYLDLMAEAEVLESSDNHEVFYAFSTGFLTLAGLIVGFRVYTQRTRYVRHHSVPTVDSEGE